MNDAKTEATPTGGRIPLLVRKSKTDVAALGVALSLLGATEASPNVGIIEALLFNRTGESSGCIFRSSGVAREVDAKRALWQRRRQAECVQN